jgi:hypothetical protein
VLPEVVTKAQEHFNCLTLDGVELENYGGAGTAGSHWEGRIMYNEFMTGISSRDIRYSAITMALFRSTGWYAVDYTKAEVLSYGHKQGCNFV